MLIIGKRGYIATRIRDTLKNTPDILYTTSNNNPDPSDLPLDLKEPKKFNYNRVKDNWIVLLASISSPDICENQYEVAYKINVEGTSQFIERCLHQGARVLFFSTDVVAGQTSGVVDENTAPNSVGKYAAMKIEVENRFFSEKNFKTLRTSYVFSRDDKYTRYLVNCLKNNEEAEIFHPFYRSVIYVEDVIEALCKLQSQWSKFPGKILNLCGEDLISRKDMAECFNEIHQNKLRYRITTPGEDFFQARPKTIHLRSLYLEELLGRKPISIYEAMKREFCTGSAKR